VAHFAHLTSDNGLAQNTIETILQDSRGFMWIGTADGLSRFDGYRFITYRRDLNTPNGLRNNWVRTLYEDRDGIIWIGTEGGGASKFDPATETFTHYLPDPQNPNTLAGDRIFNIFQDSSGAIWFTGPGNTHINRFDPQTETFTCYAREGNTPPVFRGEAVWDIAEDAAGDLWLPAGGQVARYDRASDSFTYYPLPAQGDRREQRLIDVQNDMQGNLWVAGQEGLYRFDAASETFAHHPAVRRVEDVAMDADGLFWIAAAEGLYVFDPRTGNVVQHHRNEPTRPNSLSNNRLREVYFDREGVLWIGTNDAGLNVYHPQQAQFAHYRHNPLATVSLSSGTIADVFALDDQRAWIVTSTALDQVDFATGELTTYPLPGISANVVYQDRAGVIWIGAAGLRLLRMDVATGEFSDYPLTSPVTLPTPPKSIIAISEDNEGALWIAVNHDGLYRLGADGEPPEFYRTPLAPQAGNTPVDPEQARNLPTSPITDLYLDRAGNLWVTTLNGLHRFDVQARTYQTFRLNPADSGPDSYMETLLEDADGILWVASRDGLIRFDPITGDARYYTEQDGLPTNYLVGILQDEQGDLWLSSKRGLSRFLPASETFRNYTAAAGLQGNEFSARVFAALSDGRLLFGGTNGLTLFDPQRLMDNLYQPAVVLTNLSLFNQPVLPAADSVLRQPIGETEQIRLTHEQDIVSFEFTALSYAAPAQSRYRYQLQGFEAGWTEVDSGRRFVTYTNLPAGNYTFRVQATNSDGIWSEQQAALRVTVLPPWWEENWFRAAAALALVAAVLGGYQWRVRRVAQRNRELEQEVARQTAALQQRAAELQASQEHLRKAKDVAESANRAKSTFLANMSHELRSPLNAILGFAQVLKRSTQVADDTHDNLDIILQSGEHLLALINQVLNLSKIEAGQMMLDETDFDVRRLLREIEGMFVLKAEDKHLLLEFDTPPDLPTYLRADVVKLRQVLINLIGNALKFTSNGGVAVRVQSAPDAARSSFVTLRFEVEDTGAGIAREELATLFEAFTQTSSGRKAQEGTGLGLAISQRFVQLMGGKLTVSSQVGHGTTFAFSVQCQLADGLDAPEAEPLPQVVALEPGQPRYRMLIVDDKWVNRQLLVKLLTPFGFELREAQHGEEAVEVAQVFQPHLVWMDLRMPIMDGIEATRQIKAEAKVKAPVIIALTASVFDEDKTAVLASGCDDFLRKPFRTAEIFEALRKHLHIRFSYAAEARTTDINPAPQKLDDFRSALLTLPADLNTWLIEGAELGDVALLKATIDDIRQHDTRLADALYQCVDRFEYDVLLELMQEQAV
jgi:signal transduction histidine kinase/ligand-binding sensor domain-containing protein/DNA-binding NarL/FixJ family response regulator